MPTIVGILTFISMINKTSESSKERQIFIFQHFSFYEQLKFHAQLSWAWKKFKTSGPGLIQLIWDGPLYIKSLQVIISIVNNIHNGGLRTTKAQTSLRIRAVLSAPLLFSYWKVSYQNLLQAKFHYSS